MIADEVETIHIPEEFKDHYDKIKDVMLNFFEVKKKIPDREYVETELDYNYNNTFPEVFKKLGYKKIRHKVFIENGNNMAKLMVLSKDSPVVKRMLVTFLKNYWKKNTSFPSKSEVMEYINIKSYGGIRFPFTHSYLKEEAVFELIKEGYKEFFDYVEWFDDHYFD